MPLPQAMRARGPEAARCAWLLAIAATVAFVLLAAGAVRAEDTPAAPTPAAAAPAVAAIPLPEIARRGDDVAAYLRGLTDRLVPGPEIDRIAAELPALRERVRAQREQATRVLALSPPLREVDYLADAWNARRDELDRWRGVLTARATDLEREIQGLAELRAVWRATRDDAQAANAPPAVIERVKGTLASLQATRKDVEARREEILVLQDRVVQEAAVCREGLEELARYRRAAMDHFFVPDSAPVWEGARWAGMWSDAAARLREAVAADLATVRDYLAAQSLRIPFQLALFAVVLAMLRRARARTHKWLAEDQSLARVAGVFELPVSSALVLTLLATPWIYPQPPPALRSLVILLALVPALRILRRLVDATLLPGLYAVAALLVADRLRGVCAVLPLLEQVLFLAEMFAAAVFLRWMLDSGRLARVSFPRLPAIPPWAPAAAARFLLALFGFALLAGALGYLQLARFIQGAVLGSGVAATLLFAALRVADALWAALLRARPARRLRVVQHYRALVQRRGERLLGWLALAAWAAASLGYAHALEPLREAVARVLTATVSVGALSVSLGDLLAFGVTVWLAFALSRLARFVLAEDVFPRVPLARGLPYALSNLLHYTILFLGFVIGLAAMGLDLDRFAILAGAFGVGIGFGLQNIVNNFVSGLILLFERPLQVGDTVQIGTLTGEIRRIGIRASTVRTWEGAEVIVPNANLIAEPVTNWTLSDRLRRIDVPVGVAYGTEPERVLAILRGVAAAHPLVLDAPPPVALFTGFGDSALDFQLRAWTDQFDQWVVTRSELAVAIAKAFRDARITIPFPQRDVRLSATQPVAVRVVDGDVAKTS